MVALMVLSIVVGAQSATGPLTVRVDAARGAPRLLVNGQPVRARMFYGQPASGVLALTREGARLSFTFRPSADANAAGTMHFRFGQSPGTIFLDNLQITEMETGREVVPRQTFEGQGEFAQHWMVWPPDERNTVGRQSVESGVGESGSAGLRVEITAPRDGVWPDYHLYLRPNLTLKAGKEYRVSFWARAEPARNLTTAFYLPGQTFLFLGGPPGHYDSQVKMAADAGVDFVSFSVPLPWPAPGEEVDWTGVDAICEQTLAANPRALLLPRIGVYAPAWWLEANPDARMRWDTEGGPAIATVASDRFLADGAERLEALVRHLESKFGNRIAGYHPCGQNTGEWFYFDAWEPRLNGYSPADEAAFRAWLRAKYRTDAALQAAWGGQVSLASAAVPSPSARRAAPAGVLRDPRAERQVVDFNLFQQDAMAEAVCRLAKSVRKATAGRKLVVFFFGYVFEFGGLPMSPANSGHYASRRVMECPDIDVLCAPISYFDRGPGESAPCMSAAESIALAGKMWLNEDDTRTHLTREENFPGHEHRLENAQQTVALLRRNVAQEATRHFATWWMDLPASGWFDDPALWEEMKRLRAIDMPLLASRAPFRPEIALVVDEAAMNLVTISGSRATNALVSQSRAALGRMGAPYGQYLQDDVERGRVGARVFVLTSAWQLTRERRRALKAALRGRSAIWCYAPGYLDGDRPSLDAMRELTGFRLAPVATRAWATPTALGRSLGLTDEFGLQEAVSPLFAVADARPEEVLATYPDGSAAVALRRGEEHTALFVGPPRLTPQVLRIAARAARAHLYTETDCVVYANAGYIGLHGTRDGPVTLHLRAPGRVVDAYTGSELGAGTRVAVPLQRAETRILRIEPIRAPTRARRGDR